MVAGYLRPVRRMTCRPDAWGFLIAGAIFFPVAVVHGWGIWLGIW